MQVEEIVRERIRQGAYPPDRRMPSEERLAVELQVSRASVRTALASLAAEGYIRRRHGDGTYARARSYEIGLPVGKGWEIEHQIQASGRRPSLRVLEKAFRAATPDETSQLSLSAAEPVLVFRRLFFADEEPAALIASTARFAGLAMLAQDALDEAAALPPLDFLARFQERPTGSGRVHFKAILADRETASLLAVEPGSPLLVMDSVLYDLNGQPLMVERELYPGPQGFQMPLGSIRP